MYALDRKRTLMLQCNIARLAEIRPSASGQEQPLGKPRSVGQINESQIKTPTDGDDVGRIDRECRRWALHGGRDLQVVIANLIETRADSLERIIDESTVAL